MKPIRVLLSVVGIAFAMSLVTGCVGGNPVSVTEPESGGLFKIAATDGLVPGDTVGRDTFLVDQTVIFIPVDRNGKKDSVLSSTWVYGDGNTEPVTGLKMAVHKFSIPAEYVLELRIVWKNSSTTPVTVSRRINIVRQLAPTPIVTPTVNSDSSFWQVAKTDNGAGKWIIRFASRQVNVDTAGGNPVVSFWGNSEDGNIPLYTGATLNGGIYYYDRVMTPGKSYNVQIVKGPSRFLALNEYPAKYRNPSTSIMGIFVGYNGVISPWNAVPSDSGKTGVIITPVTPVSVVNPGDSGDTGVSAVVRVAANAAADSFFIWTRIDSLGCTSVANVLYFFSNLPGSDSLIAATKATVNGRDWALVKLTKAQLLSAGYNGIQWTIVRGPCYFPVSAATKSVFYRPGLEKGFLFNARVQTHNVAKRTAGAADDMLIPN